MGLVDGGISVGVAVGVRVRDLDSSKGLAGGYTWTLRRRTVQGLEQFVVLVGVSVGPAVDGDGLNIARGIETSGGEHAAELVAHVTLERFEGRADEFEAPGAVLVFAIFAGRAGSAQKVKQAGFVGRAGIVVVAHGDGEIQGDVGEVRSR